MRSRGWGGMECKEGGVEGAERGRSAVREGSMCVEGEGRSESWEGGRGGGV